MRWLRDAFRSAGARCALALALLASIAAPLAAQTPEDYPIRGGHFYTQTAAGRGGFGVRDLFGVEFFSAYQRLGGPDALGFPISRPFFGPAGFLYQAFQRGLLQWREDLGVALLANTMELLEPHNATLLHVYGIPLPLRPRAATFAEEVQERLSWLTNEEIAAAFFSDPATGEPWDLDAAVSFYGLPQSFPERRGPFVVQRFQRIPLQLWVESVTGMPPPGTVVGVLAGSIARDLGLIPRDATTPEPPVPPLEEPAPPGAPPPGRAPGTYVVQPGDTLSEIARQLLGDAALWPRLLEANRDQLDRPEDLRAGMVIRVPGAVVPPAPPPPEEVPVLEEK